MIMLVKLAYIVFLIAPVMSYLVDDMLNITDVIPTYAGDCRVTLFMKYTECQDVAGNWLNMFDDVMVPNGTSCSFAYANQQFRATCQDGKFKLSLPEEDYLTGSNHSTETNRLSEASFERLGSTDCVVVCQKEQPISNNPPRIESQASILTPLPIYIDAGETEALAEWKEPNITDVEDGWIQVMSSPPGYESGNKFSEGSYTVFFVGTDSGGLAVYDSISFEVKVYRCRHTIWPTNGILECDRNDITIGTICRVVCEPGYSLQGSSGNIKCDANETWIPNVPPNCAPNQCKDPPIIPYGKVECWNDSFVYGNICDVVCDSGFRLQGTRRMKCDIDGNWDRSPICIDDEPPRFKYCPSDLQVHIDASDDTAGVEWDEPIGIDNSHEVPKIIKVNGYKPGDRFKAGSYYFNYTIHDDQQNEGQPCVFEIKVITISCAPPDFGMFIRYDCPDTYTLGAICFLTCETGYLKFGAKSIKCDFDTANNDSKALVWTWEDDELAPVCRESNCSRDALKEPLNGALACIEWPHGQMCQMQCNEGYDIPNIGSGHFVCGKSDGIWHPSSFVPECSERFDTLNIRLVNEFYFYTGKCNDSIETLDEIKENFIHALNTSDLFEECTNVTECEAEFIDVSCGPVSLGRHKRALRSATKRDTSTKLAYILNFDLVLPYTRDEDKRPDELFAEYQEKLLLMSDRIQAEADSGHFDIDISDLTVNRDSYGIGSPVLDCPPGMVSRIETATCVGCPKGYYADKNTKCQECPFGTYQNSTNSLKCEVCPPNTNTTDRRSESITQCLEFCGAGEFSPTKLVPCTKCSSKSYQTNPKSTKCVRCERNTQTEGDGATLASGCKGFDIQLSASGVKVKPNVEEDVLSLFMWIKIHDTATNSSLEITKSFNIPGLILNFSPNLELVYNNSVVAVIEANIRANRWTSVVLVVDKTSDELQLYIDGVITYENRTGLNTNSHVLDREDTIVLSGGMTISAFSLLSSNLSSTEVSTLSSSCSSPTFDTIFSMDDLAEAKNAKVIVPSVCDAIDECDSFPCGNHTCINYLGSYECLCNDGYTGQHCQIPPDFCKNSNCMNDASCINGSTNYTCECTYGFSGAFCEKKAANGAWSGWSGWSSCTESCGEGIKTRIRRCDSPPPELEGDNCTGNGSESISCNLRTCPECLQLETTMGLNMVCKDTPTKQICTISCRPGMYFTNPRLPQYECGIATGYKWNHQNENNTKARLPACSSIQQPVKLGVAFEGSFDSLPCTDSNKEQLKASLEDRLASIDSVRNSSCQVKIKGIECTDEVTKQPVTIGTLTVGIELESHLASRNEELTPFEENENNTELSDEFVSFIMQTLELEEAAQALLIDAEELFQATIDNGTYTLTNSSSPLTYTLSTICPSGYVRMEYFCVESPVGSFSDGIDVRMCPVGQYQDETAQSYCKLCPNGKTTDGVGSTNISDCFAMEYAKSDNIDFGAGAFVAVGISMVAVFGLAVVAIVCLCKHRRKRREKIESQDATQQDDNPLQMSD